MSTVKTNNVQIGQSVTATNNFTWYQPASPDGTVRLGNGNSGSVTDLVTLTSAGNLGIGTSSPAQVLDVQKAQAWVTATSTTGTNSSVFKTANTGGSSYFGRESSAGTVFGGGAYATVVYGSGAYPMSFFTNDTKQMTLDSSGNLGLGVTPSAWVSTFKAFQIGARGSVYAGSDASMRLAYNAFYDGTSYKRIAASSASQWIADTDGSFAWFQAGSSTAGSAISFTQAMTLDASGNLLVGTTSSPTGSPVGKVLALSGVDIEGTAAINVTTSTTLLSRTSGVGGMFFVQGYNASGGAQGWWLLACIGATLTTIASNNATGLTVTFSSPGGGLRAVTASGTLIATCVAFTM